MKKKELKLLQQFNAEAIAKYGDKLWDVKPKAPIVNAIIENVQKNLKEKVVSDRYSGEGKPKHYDYDYIIKNDAGDEMTLTYLEYKKIIDGKDMEHFQGDQKIENPKVAKKIISYVNSRIKEAVEAGELTHPKEYYAKKSRKAGNRAKKR